MSQRMIDRLFAEGALELNRSTQQLEPWSLDALRDGGAARTGHRLFDDAEVLVIDNVTKYLYEVCEQEIWTGDEYPNCAPPFPIFWMETRAPAYSRSGKTIYRWQGQHAWGALFIANEIPTDLSSAFASPDVQQRLEEEKRLAWHSVIRAFDFHGLCFPATPPATDEAGRAWFASLPQTCQEALHAYGYVRRSLEGVHLTEGLTVDVRWHYTIVLFLQIEAYEAVRGPFLYGTALVSAAGQLVPIPTIDGGRTFNQFRIRHGECMSAEERQQVIDLGNTMLMPMWLGLSFMHCKNVTLTKEDPCHARKPPKQGEKCRRLHYHVLNIKPMQEVLRREGQSQTTGLKQALSICRGHFKDYRHKGLFGKYQGLFWWDAHIRGHSKEGVVIKDYAMHAPLPTTPEGVTS